MTCQGAKRMRLPRLIANLIGGLVPANQHVELANVNASEEGMKHLSQTDM